MLSRLRPGTSFSFFFPCSISTTRCFSIKLHLFRQPFSSCSSHCFPPFPSFYINKIGKSKGKGKVVSGPFGNEKHHNCYGRWGCSCRRFWLRHRHLRLLRLFSIRYQSSAFGWTIKPVPAATTEVSLLHIRALEAHTECSFSRLARTDREYDPGEIGDDSWYRAIKKGARQSRRSSRVRSGEDYLEESGYRRQRGSDLEQF